MWNNIFVTFLLILLAPIAIMVFASIIIAITIPSLIFTSLWNLVMPILAIGLPQITVVQGFASVGILFITRALIRGFIKLVNFIKEEQTGSERSISSIIDDMKQNIHNWIESSKSSVAAQIAPLKLEMAFKKNNSLSKHYRKFLFQTVKRT